MTSIMAQSGSQLQPSSNAASIAVLLYHSYLWAAMTNAGMVTHISCVVKLTWNLHAVILRHAKNCFHTHNDDLCIQVNPRRGKGVQNRA